MFSLYARLAAIAVVATFLAGTHWKAYSNGKATIRAEWQADVAQRTADALQASEQARKTEQGLQAKVRKATDDYHLARKNTDHLAAAASDGLRNLEAILAKSHNADPAPRDTGGNDADPRLDIIAECARAYRLVDAKARELADQVRALQAVAPIVRVSDPAEKR